MADPFIKTWIVGDAQVVQTLTAIPEKTHQKLVVTIGRLAIEVQAHTVQDYLSGQALKTRTGTLRRSVHTQVTDTPQDIRGIVGTNVRYAGIWEFGGVIPAHDRIVSQVFGHQLTQPVVGHWKERVIAPRSYLRPSLHDKADRIRSEIKRAVLEGVRT